MSNFIRGLRRLQNLRQDPPYMGASERTSYIAKQHMGSRNVVSYKSYVCLMSLTSKCQSRQSLDAVYLNTAKTCMRNQALSAIGLVVFKERIWSQQQNE